MKYIIFTKLIGDLPQEIPILFPNELVHLEVAKALVKVVGTSKIVAAGEFNSMQINSEGFHGKSVSIGIKSRGPRDGVMISLVDYLKGIS